MRNLKLKVFEKRGRTAIRIKVVVVWTKFRKGNIKVLY